MEGKGELCGIRGVPFFQLAACIQGGLGEYVGKDYMESQNRSRYLIEEALTKE